MGNFLHSLNCTNNQEKNGCCFFYIVVLYNTKIEFWVGKSEDKTETRERRGGGRRELLCAMDCLHSTLLNKLMWWQWSTLSILIYTWNKTIMISVRCATRVCANVRMCIIICTVLYTCLCRWKITGNILGNIFDKMFIQCS